MSVIYAVRATPHTFITANTSNSASGTTTGTALDRGDTTGQVGPLEIVVRLQNGASAPTAPARLEWSPSPDGTNYNDWMIAAVHNTTANSAESYTFTVPEAYRYVNVRVTGNTGQAVTIVSCRGYAVSYMDIA